MRITYRNEDTRDYWARRWAGIPADGAAENSDVYPLRYAEQVIGGDREGRILEAGCGNGRVLRFYHERGYPIIGMDYVPICAEKLQQADSSLSVCVGDVTKLAFEDESFRHVLAFGLYHNLPPEEGMKGLRETFRVLERGGRLCASYRADSLHSRLIDARAGEGTVFHKANMRRSELVRWFCEAGFVVDEVIPVENMPLLYKYSWFRDRSHRQFDESKGRREGYRLSVVGRMVQNALFRLFPDALCNVFIVIARKV